MQKCSQAQLGRTSDCTSNCVMKLLLITAVMLITVMPAAGASRKPAAGASRKSDVRNGHPYRRQYVRETFGKKAVAGVGARAGLKKAVNGGNLGSHLASGMGTHVIKNSIQYPVAALRHEDLRYHRSTRQGVAPRMKHALVSTVVTRKTTSGKKTVAAGRISGAMGSGVIASTWAPAAAGGAATGGISLGAVAATNVAREFWPQKKNARRRRPGGTLAR